MHSLPNAKGKFLQILLDAEVLDLRIHIQPSTHYRWMLSRDSVLGCQKAFLKPLRYI